MLNEERTRGITFMNNEFIGTRNETVINPTIFFSNFWQEKPELIKNPDVSNFNLYSFKIVTFGNFTNDIFYGEFHQLL